MGGAMDALKTVWNQFLKDSDKLPGWVPLFVVMLVVVDRATPPDHISLWGRTLPLSREFLAAALTLLFYTVGDAIDEVVFKTGQEGARGTREIWKERYSEQLKAARDEMGAGNGLYSVALKLVTAGEKHRGTRPGIHIPNEAAKCLRALILPFTILAAPFFARGRVALALTCLAVAAALLLTYPLLKVRHLRRLYVSASGLAQKEKLYHDEELGTMRLVFWDGNLVGSACSVPKRQTTGNRTAP
jgi:hypothetical protein